MSLAGTHIVFQFCYHRFARIIILNLNVRHLSGMVVKRHHVLSGTNTHLLFINNKTLFMASIQISSNA